MMIIIIRCELGAWHALIHGEIVRNKFMIPEAIIEEGSSSHTSSSCPCEQNYVRMDWSPDWAHTSMSWLWILSLRGRASMFRRWHLTERQAAIWANILGNGPRTTAWWEEDHFSQWGYEQTRALTASRHALWLSIPRRSWIATELCRSCWANTLFWCCCLIHRTKATLKQSGHRERAQRMSETFSEPCTGYLWGYNLYFSCRLGF